MVTGRTGASHEQGIALIGVVILALILALLGAALLDLAGQESSSAAGATDVAVAQAVADENFLNYMPCAVIRSLRVNICAKY